MKQWFSDPDGFPAFIRHPFVLAGGAVIVLLGMTAAALVIVDSARGDTVREPRVDVQPLTSTPGPNARTATATGVRGITRGTTSVRSAPGERGPVLGTLPRGSEVEIDGRTADSTWLRIIFPPRSEFHGWVEVDALDITGTVSALAVATAEPPVVVSRPTQEPIEVEPDPLEVTPDDPPTPEPTATPDAVLPDLVVGTTPIVSGGVLVVTIVNQGAGTAQGDLVVAVFNPDATQLLGGVTVPGTTLAPGASIDVITGYQVTQSATLLIIVDPNGAIEEADDMNNQITVSVSVGNTNGDQNAPQAVE
jgi:uncharacterized protein YraI